MPRTVTAGLDGSPESRAAAEWAAREAGLRHLPLRIVHVPEPVPAPAARAPLLGGETRQGRPERVPCEAAEGLRLRRPGVEVITDRRTGTRSVVGSVSLAVNARAGCPVVLARAGEQAADEHEMDPAGVPSAATPFRPAVVGLGLGAPDDTLLEFAFDAAGRRGASLRAVHGWSESPASFHRFYGDAALRDALARRQATSPTEVLRSWRRKFRDVQVNEESRCGGAAQVILDASHEASLVVVGRRRRTRPAPAHRLIRCPGAKSP